MINIFVTLSQEKENGFHLYIVQPRKIDYFTNGMSYGRIIFLSHGCLKMETSSNGKTKIPSALGCLKMKTQME